MEADDRERGCVRSIADFLALRRETAGVKCVLDLHLLRHDIPEDVMTHPSVQRLTDKTMDILVFINVGRLPYMSIHQIITVSFE